MLSPEAAKKKGAEIRRAYLDAVEGLEDLVEATRRVAERGSIRAIDKRQIIVDKEHKALNCLLQGSAAVIAKRWLLITDHNLRMSCLLYTSPSPRDRGCSRMPSSA